MLQRWEYYNGWVVTQDKIESETIIREKCGSTHSREDWRIVVGGFNMYGEDL